MEGSGELKATLDACIIFQLAACDTLLHSSEAGLYSPVWSTEILDEVIRTSLKLLNQDKHAGLIKRIVAMNLTFPLANCDSTIEIEDNVKQLLLDPGDAHVIQTAVASQSNFIVTENLKDFPENLLAQLGIMALSFDSFMSLLFDLDTFRTMHALAVLTSEKINPPVSILEHLFQLEHLSPNFNRKVRAYTHLGS